MNPCLSVVIPTLNRRETLEKVLPKLAAQSLPAAQYELLLCDSGSTDGTAELVTNLAIPNLRMLMNSGKSCRSSARNTGIRAARGEIVLFTDADILASEDLLEQHWSFHATRPHSAAVGLEIQIDSLAEYEQVRSNPCDTGRHMHGREGKTMSWLFFLTGNASVPRQALFDVGLFDEGFSAYGHEDLELGYRLQKAGYPVLYNPLAINYHWHPVPFEEKCDKIRASGAATRRFYEKHNDWLILLRLGINPVSLGLHALVSHLPSCTEALATKRYQSGLSGELTLQYHYLSGYKAAL